MWRYRRARRLEHQPDAGRRFFEIRVRVNTLSKGENAPEMLFKVVEAGDRSAELAV